MRKRLIAVGFAASLCVAPVQAASPPAGAGPSAAQGAMGWSEYLSQSSTANQAYNGTVRTGGTVTGTPYTFGYFQAICYSSVAGTLNVYNFSSVGGTLTLVGTVSVPAGGIGVMKVPAFGAQFLSGFANGANGGTFTMYDGFTAF